MKTFMNNVQWLWPSSDMDLKAIKNDEYRVTVKWTHKYYDDFKRLSYQFFECGQSIFNEVIKSGHNNIKSDMWFLTGIFLLRQSIELGLKALLCRITAKNKEIQNIFEDCCHDLSALFLKYEVTGNETYLAKEEKEWLKKYLESLELIDSKSDIFRFPFDDDFLKQYRNKFLDNVYVSNNMLQAFMLVMKCCEKGVISEESRFDDKLKPEFFVFASHGIGNCYLWQSLSDDGFHAKVTGYIAVIDYIFNSQEINLNTKVYPLMFMFRNALELCLKRLFYCRVNEGIPVKIFNSKRKSHLVKKDLWKNVKPIIKKYINQQGNDNVILDIVENQINIISSIDKNGDNFRYPTSYSLEYRNDNFELDLKNVYECLMSIVNFLNGCDSLLKAISDNQAEIEAEYKVEMRADIDWY